MVALNWGVLKGSLFWRLPNESLASLPTCGHGGGLTRQIDGFDLCTQFGHAESGGNESLPDLF